jgi:nuclear-control-of-ATPase protein 2
VQRLKLDTEAAMLELDQILRANELSISLMAAVPSLLLMMAAAHTVYRWLAPAAPDVKREAVPCRMTLAQLHRTLQAAAAEAAASASATAAAPGGGAPPPFAVVASAAAQEAAAQERGVALYLAHRAHREAQRLYRLRDRSSRWSEWPQLAADLQSLASGAPPAQMLATLERMVKAYAVLQP